MALPLLDFPQTSRNYRVEGFIVPGDDTPRVFSTDTLPKGEDQDRIIAAAYRQIFNEQHLTKSSRIAALESQLRSGQITVREFIRGLVTSSHFRVRYYDTNNNYRFAQLCIQRLLGRDITDEREKLAWSIVLATKGVEGFADDILNSQEYLENFGDDIVPYQRRRVIPQRSTGELPFERMARYDANHLNQLKSLGNDFSASRSVSSFLAGSGLPPESARRVGAVLTYAGAAALSLGLIAVFLSWFGLIQL